MHGVIFAELKKYVCKKLGEDTWHNLLKNSGFESKIYLPTKEYPDSEVSAMVTEATKMTGKSLAAILEDFGEFIVPDLIEMYSALIEPQWKTLDVIERTEETIHKVVRIKNPGARPPELKVSRPDPNVVVVTYTSARKMCALGRGIIKGIARHYGEQVSVSDVNCMLKGDPTCKISVQLL